MPGHPVRLFGAVDELPPLAAALWICLADGSGLDQACRLCARISAAAPAATVLAAGWEGVHSGLKALLDSGASDLLYMPASDHEIAFRLDRAAGRMEPARTLDTAHAAIDPRLSHVIACGEAFRSVLRQLPTFAACNATVLISGETGTGKEVIAHAVHYLSDRAAKPWVPINCGAIPVDLVESELFGHVRGAYTTAATTRPGLVDEAAGGTLFLDDIDCLPLAAQAKLLRLLQEREFRPVGSNQLRHADIRFVAATNRDLPKEVERGNFRRDHYYRLNVVSLKLPALRGRADDIEALARHFAATDALQFNKPAIELARPALRKLVLHDWPGNVRELQHTIERAVLLAPGPVLRAADIQLDGRECEDGPGTSFQEAKARVVEQFERGYIIELLRRCNGNITQASRESGKHRRAFFELMRKHGIKGGGLRDDDGAG
jgi:DNA-binding NtrC family response regulator